MFLVAVWCVWFLVMGCDMKLFTEADVVHGRICAGRADLVEALTPWQRRGLQQTRSGYGAKLNTGLKINYGGKLRRLYATCYSNVASVWFCVKGVKIHVS